MDYLEVLKRTWSDMQEAEIPPELYEAAFAAGLKFYSPVTAESAAGVVALPAASPVTPTESRMAVAGDASARLGAETGIARETLDELLYFDADGSPGINGGARRLGKNNAERTRTIALVLAGARHFANDELEVPLDQIRDVCKQFGIYDQNNFAAYVSEVPGFTLSGPRANRVLRAKSDAALRFRQRVSEVLGSREQ